MNGVKSDMMRTSEGGQPGKCSLFGAIHSVCLSVLPHGKVEHEGVHEGQQSDEHGVLSLPLPSNL
jgi:hypothetical protein